MFSELRQSHIRPGQRDHWVKCYVSGGPRVANRED